MMKSITIEINPDQERYLRGLYAIGLFGTTLEEVVLRMVDEKLQAAIVQGWVGEIPPKK